MHASFHSSHSRVLRRPERSQVACGSSHGADQGATRVRACAAAMNSLGMVASNILQCSPCPSSATPSAPLQRASPQSLSWLLGWKQRGTPSQKFFHEHFEKAWKLSFDQAFFRLKTRGARVHRGDGEQGPRVGAQGRFQHQPEARRFWGERDARCLLPTASLARVVLTARRASQEAFTSMGLAFGVGTPSKTKKVCAPSAASAFLHAPFPARRGGKAQPRTHTGAPCRLGSRHLTNEPGAVAGSRHWRQAAHGCEQKGASVRVHEDS